MNPFDHSDFVSCDFATPRVRAARGCTSGLRPLRLAAPLVLSGCEGESPSPKMIRVTYDPENFQHVSLIGRLFGSAFVNHSDDGDRSGLATVIKALTQITFVLSERQINLQFTSPEPAQEFGDRTTVVDLRPFLDAAPGGVQITWLETLMWRLDSEGKLVERWQAPAWRAFEKAASTLSQS